CTPTFLKKVFLGRQAGFAYKEMDQAIENGRFAMKHHLVLSVTVILLGASVGLSNGDGDKKKSVPTLIKALTDADAGNRRDAALALAAWGKSARLAIPALCQALKDPSDEVRQAAALALGSMGPAARGSVSALTAALDDNKTNVRAAAA